MNTPLLDLLVIYLALAALLILHFDKKLFPASWYRPKVIGRVKPETVRVDSVALSRDGESASVGYSCELEELEDTIRQRLFRLIGLKTSPTDDEGDGEHIKYENYQPGANHIFATGNPDPLNAAAGDRRFAVIDDDNEGHIFIPASESIAPGKGVALSEGFTVNAKSYEYRLKKLIYGEPAASMMDEEPDLELCIRCNHYYEPWFRICPQCGLGSANLSEIQAIDEQQREVDNPGGSDIIDLLHGKWALSERDVELYEALQAYYDDSEHMSNREARERWGEFMRWANRNNYSTAQINNARAWYKKTGGY